MGYAVPYSNGGGVNLFDNANRTGYGGYLRDSGLKPI
jgi:hypothetical protein